MSFDELESRLSRTSNKFGKACNQIQALKQRIAQLMASFSFYDRINQQTSSSSNSNSTTNNNGCCSLVGSSRHFIRIDGLEAYENNIEIDFNVSTLKESLRMQIESLQSVKTAYVVYARRKADEITRLQCDLYGEEAVREAYGQEAVLPNDSHQQQQQQQQQHQQQTIPSHNEPQYDTHEQQQQHQQFELRVEATEASNFVTESGFNYSNNGTSSSSREEGETTASTHDQARSESAALWTPWSFDSSHLDHSEYSLSATTFGSASTSSPPSPSPSSSSSSTLSTDSYFEHDQHMHSAAAAFQHSSNLQASNPSPLTLIEYDFCTI